jgi:hypothetical protein
MGRNGATFYDENENVNKNENDSDRETYRHP